MLYNDTTDATATFLSWRLVNDGPAASSNMYLIDSAFLADRARLTTLEALKFVNLVNATYVSGSTFIASPSTISSYVDGTVILLNLDTTNPGTTQINMNSLGLRSLVKYNTAGTSTINLDAGDLIKSRLYFFKYDLASTTWIWISATSGDQLNVPGTTGNVVTVTSTGSIVGTTTQSLLLSQTIHAATAKTTPVDADEIALVDSAASNVLKRVTWANAKATLVTSLGAMIASATNKTTPVAADLLGIADSAASNATKKMSITNLFSIFGTLLDAYTEKTTPVGADEFVIADSAASFAAKKSTLTQIVAVLKTLIATDTLAAPTDITTNNATSSAHGFLKKLTAATADTFRGDGTYGGIYAPEGFLQNGVITPSVASNNLTVAIKTLSGGNPSVTDPVYIRINGVIRSITAALSATASAGTNWMNSGGLELQTLEVDYFVYLGYNATDGVVIGFARFPYARQYSDFSVTTTNEKYAKISNITTAASTDFYNVVGMFAATLSAGAGYTWTVPTFTAINLVNRPIYETRWLNWTPTHTRTGTNYTNLPTNLTSKYKLINQKNNIIQRHQQNATPGGTLYQRITLPFASAATLAVYAFNESTAALMNGYTTSSNMTLYLYDATVQVTASEFYGVNGSYPVSLT